ncbi:hypothetical protein PUN28_016767 [Cardiocondyla obscurior]|uniref:Uncharacterized protein n=1 Tax=Cardiocondyla obscurior TaxID=286306 RepID=A0AAW2ESD4_9HYME
MAHLHLRYFLKTSANGEEKKKKNKNSQTEIRHVEWSLCFEEFSHNRTPLLHRDRSIRVVGEITDPNLEESSHVYYAKHHFAYRCLKYFASDNKLNFTTQCRRRKRQDTFLKKEKKIGEKEIKKKRKRKLI